MKSKIYYMLSDKTSGEPFRSLIMGLEYVRKTRPYLADSLAKHDLSGTHRLVAVVPETRLDTIFHDFQGEHWSPEGEARELIQGLGLGHTSLSVGDIVQQGEKYFFCDSVGWVEI